MFEECTENFDEVKMTKMTLAEYANKCKCSCTIYEVLFSIIFTINVGIGSLLHFIYYRYMNPNKKQLLKKTLSFKQWVIETINGKHKANKH